jgi:hypothetical protein
VHPNYFIMAGISADPLARGFSVEEQLIADFLASEGNEAELLMAARPAWATTPGGFVNWLKNLQKAGTPLSAGQADAIISEAKSLGVDVRLAPAHAGTNWDVPHLNIGGNGQVHLEVPAGYTNPGVAQGHP